MNLQVQISNVNCFEGDITQCVGVEGIVGNLSASTENYLF